MSKFNYTMVAVLVFIVVLFFAMKAEAEGYVGLGKSTFNSHMMTGDSYGTRTGRESIELSG